MLNTFLLLFITPLFMFSLSAASVLLYNDAPFPMSATILSSTGEVMGRQSIQPQEQSIWQNSNVNTTGISQSPFSVIFYCSNSGEVYGTVTGVQTGAMVMPSQSQGAHFCKPKDDKKGKEEQKKSDLQYQPHPINPNQWRKQERY